MSGSKYQRSRLALAITSSLAISATHAATITVDTLDDPGTVDNCSLRSAITAVNTQAIIDACNAGDGLNDEIGFEPGLTGTINLSEGPLALAADVIITGPGAENLQIDAGGNSGIFEVYDEVVAQASDLTLTGGYASYGGAFYLQAGSRLNLYDMVIDGNQATENGGAIEVFGGELYVLDSTFSNNSAGNNGGAIAVTRGEALVSGSYFTGNSAELGGAVQVNFFAEEGTGPVGDLPAALEAKLVVESSTLTTNMATYGGAAGAGYAYGGGPVETPSNSKRTGGSAARGIAPTVNLEINSSTITFNTAIYGGAVGAQRYDSGGPGPLGDPPPPEPALSNLISINDSLLQYNEADYGGAVAAAYSGVVIGESLVADNTALISGGGLFSARQFDVAPAPIRGIGGPTPFLYLIDSSIYDNSVSSPLIRGGGSITPLVGSGAGVSVSDSIGYIVDSAVTGNDAPNRGGGILALNSDLAVVYSAVSTNSGGGIYSNGSDAYVVYSRIIANAGSESFYSGAAGLQCEFESNCGVKYSEVSENAGDAVGGIAAGFRDIGPASPVRIVNSTISGNSGDSVGGILAQELEMDFATVAYNESTEVDRGLSASFTGGVFTSDQAAIRNSIVSENTSVSGNADISIDSGSLTMNHSLVGEASGFSYTGSGNLLDVDPLLAPLDLNGGPETHGRTHALEPGSPAINAGFFVEMNLAGTGNNALTDQRGDGFDRGLAGDADMGAYEVQPGSASDLLFSDRFQHD